jgi:hypothetical protein
VVVVVEVLIGIDVPALVVVVVINPLKIAVLL